ncbi:MAG: DNA recombination protein RmuC [Paludibacteraceae bacterium]|nr:DNA recombination protein RmuC [Paludibacteraceae bacterium]
MMIVWYIILGVLLGGIIVGVLFFVRLQKKNMQLLTLQKEFDLQQVNLQKLQSAAEKLQNMELENMRLQTQLKEQQERSENELRLKEESFDTIRKEQEKNWEEQKNALKTEFQNIANRILEDKSKSFAELNKERLNSILTPLNENLKIFKERIEVVHKDNTEARSSLNTELKHLKELNRQMSEDALNLTRALKGDSKTQGDWGEMILERMLESVGLKRDVEYFVQKNLVGDDNARLRTDIIVRFPDKRDVIIDSKVSLTAYSNYMTETDETLKMNYLKEHLKSVRKHIDELSEKDYSKHDPYSLDYVMMFIPNEASYMLALQHDSDVWNYALSKKVFLTSSTNLLGMLYMVGNLWQRFRQEQNAQRIVEAGNALYEKMVTFSENFIKIGAQLQTVQKTYTDAQKQLKEGNGNLLTRFEKMKELGLAPKKTLPENMLSEE